MTKRELRDFYLEARGKLSGPFVEEQSKAILTVFQEHFVIPQGARVHLFRSVPELNEVRTQLFVDWLSERRPDIEMVFPRVVRGEKELRHHLYRKGDPLAMSAWGIEEPVPTAPVVEPESIDLVVAPLLAFDPKGYRLGYGGGFYDRFLARVGSECQTVGVSLELGYRAEGLPADPFDISLQAVVTPSKVFRFE